MLAAAKAAHSIYGYYTFWTKPVVAPINNQDHEEAEVESSLPRILIVEDDVNMLDFISTNIRGEGYNALCAINGKEALKF